MLKTILSHTPIWVYCLFVALLILGLQQTRNRSVNNKIVFVLPVIMLGLSLLGVYSNFGGNFSSWLLWLLGLVGTTFMGVSYWPLAGVSYNRGDKKFIVVGSWTPLIIILAIFFAKYVVGVLAGFRHPLLNNLLFVASMSLAYGCFSGFFAARAIGFWRIKKSFIEKTIK